MMKTFAAFGMLVLLAGCAGRNEPEGSFLNPVCMPDGSVAWRQLSNDKGEYTTPIATKANCPWNKTAAR
ncbi:MAG: hypothetical protein NVV74_00075 [Magnetospirillum sp.]|nr:hypothetical protein [Magnetospirillum sp.]